MAARAAFIEPRMSSRAYVMTNKQGHIGTADGDARRCIAEYLFADHVVSHRELNQFCRRCDIQNFHDPVFMEGDRPWSQRENCGHLLHGMTFSE